jgi:hypothetical protein
MKKTRWEYRQGSKVAREINKKQKNIRKILALNRCVPVCASTALKGSSRI